MRIVKTTLTAALFAVLSTGLASAAVTPAAVLAPVLSECPLEARSGCAGAVRDFIASRPADADLNDELIDLVAALHYQAQHPNITIDMCLELAAGMRTAASAVTLPAPQAQIKSLAATLCEGVPNSTLTSNAGSGGNSGAGGSNPPPPPPADNDDDDDDDDGDYPSFG
jgi:hypothetical protein